MAELPLGRATFGPLRVTQAGRGVVFVDELLRREREAGAREEREAAVEWLRDQGPMGSALADDIQAGEHRKAGGGV